MTTIQTLTVNGKTYALPGGGAEVDATLTQAGKAADAKAVGDQLGNIETALDAILAIQNGLIGGETA